MPILSQVRERRAARLLLNTASRRVKAERLAARADRRATLARAKAKAATQLVLNGGVQEQEVQVLPKAQPAPAKAAQPVVPPKAVPQAPGKAAPKARA